MESRTIAVSGMTCGHCARAVRAELVAIPGVSAVQVDVESGQVTITADPQPGREAVRDAVEAAGYELVP